MRQRQACWSLALLLAAVQFLAAPNFCVAGLVNFLPGGPTYTSINGTQSYNVTTGEFQSTSTPVTLNGTFITPRGFATITGTASLSEDLFVDQNGNFVSNGAGVFLTGTVTVNGAVITGNSTADPLLAGALTAFASDPPGTPAPSFYSLYNVTGGELTKPGSRGTGTTTPAFAVGSPGGLILNAEIVASGILGNFSESFSSTSVKGNGGIVISSVPEPSPLTLTLIATTMSTGLVWLRGRVSRTRAN
jgi:hypothetical protein